MKKEKKSKFYETHRKLARFFHFYLYEISLLPLRAGPVSYLGCYDDTPSPRYFLSEDAGSDLEDLTPWSCVQECALMGFDVSGTVLVCSVAPIFLFHLPKRKGLEFDKKTTSKIM